MSCACGGRGFRMEVRGVRGIVVRSIYRCYCGVAGYDPTPQLEPELPEITWESLRELDGEPGSLLDDR